MECLNCGENFEQTRKDKVFCSKKCKLKKYQLDNLEKYNEHSKRYYKNNTSKVNIKKEIYNITNKEKIKNQRSKHFQENKNKIKESRREYYKNYYMNKYNTDPHFKIKVNLRNRLNMAIKKELKTGSAVKNLGCSIEEFKIYLESKFEKDMNWDNWSMTGWHIDHIIPISSFDLSNIEEVKKACHYSNLQPLWAKENRIKSDTIQCSQFLLD